MTKNNFSWLFFVLIILFVDKVAANPETQAINLQSLCNGVLINQADGGLDPAGHDISMFKNLFDLGAGDYGVTNSFAVTGGRKVVIRSIFPYLSSQAANARLRNF